MGTFSLPNCIDCFNIPVVICWLRSCFTFSNMEVGFVYYADLDTTNRAFDGATSFEH